MKLQSIEGGRKGLPRRSGAEAICEIAWPMEETRPLRCGQDSEGKLLFYMQKHPEREDAAIVITSDRRAMLVHDVGLSQFGLHHPRCKPKLLRKVMAQSDPYGTWSHAREVPNSAPQFLAGQGEADLAAVFNDVEQVLRKHIWFRHEDTYLGLAAIVVATYVVGMSSVAPYAFLAGAKGTGKTRILEVIEALAFHGRLTIPTRPAMYRLTEFFAATLLVDEVRRDIDPRALSVIKTGYKRSGSVTVTENRVPRDYTTFGVKFFAGTKGYDDELLDRGIAILCEKAGPQAGTERFDLRVFDEDEALPLRDRLHCAALNNAERVYTLLRDDESAAGLGGREREIFLLPAVVCRVADEIDGGDRHQQLLTFAVKNPDRKTMVGIYGGLAPVDVIEAVVEYMRGHQHEVQGHPHCYVAADLTSGIARRLKKPSLTTKRIGAELVKLGLLGTQSEDRPKPYIRGSGKARQCWRLLPERVATIAAKYGVEVEQPVHPADSQLEEQE